MSILVNSILNQEIVVTTLATGMISLGTTRVIAGVNPLAEMVYVVLFETVNQLAIFLFNTVYKENKVREDKIRLTLLVFVVGGSLMLEGLFVTAISCLINQAAVMVEQRFKLYSPSSKWLNDRFFSFNPNLIDTEIRI